MKLKKKLRKSVRLIMAAEEIKEQANLIFEKERLGCQYLNMYDECKWSFPVECDPKNCPFGVKGFLLNP